MAPPTSARLEPSRRCSEFDGLGSQRQRVRAEVPRSASARKLGLFAARCAC